MQHSINIGTYIKSIQNELVAYSLVMNESFLSVWVNCDLYLNQTEMSRNRIKSNSKRITDILYRSENTWKKYLPKGILCAFSDCCYEEMYPMLKDWRDEYAGLYENIDERYSILMGYMRLCNELIKYSINQHDALVEEVRMSSNIDFSKVYRNLKMNSVNTIYSQLYNDVTISVKKLRECKDMKVLPDTDAISRCLNEYDKYIKNQSWINEKMKIAKEYFDSNTFGYGGLK